MTATEQATEQVPPAMRREAGAVGACVRRLGFHGIPLAIATAALITFLPSLWNGFVEWDDYINLFENPNYRGLGWTQIKWMFTSTLMGHYIPVTWLTFGGDYTIWGMKPFGYHLTNMLLHATNAALFYLISVRLLRKATRLSASAVIGGAVMASLLFALHPLRAESVAWATERRDVLSGLFFLVTVLLYLRSAEAPSGPRRRLLAASLACYVLAMLSKSIVMTLPVVLVLLDVYPLGRLPLRWKPWSTRDARAVLLEKIPYFGVGLAGAATAYWAVASNDFFTPAQRYGLGSRIAITGYSLWFYVEKTIVPIALSPLHELPFTVHWGEARFAWSGLAVVAITASMLAVYRRWPAGLAAWVYYGLILAPVSGLVHAGHQLTHDRYSYLSCLGVALLIGGALGSVAQAMADGRVRPWLGRAVAAVAALWIVALAALTWYQVQIWRDTETLWHYAVEADPSCAICQNNLGLAYYKKQQYQLAKERYERAIALRPDRVREHASLGLTLQEMGDYESALRHLNFAPTFFPSDPDILTNMAVTLFGQGRHAEALRYLERGYQVNPNHIPVLVNLGVARIGMGEADRALPYLLRANELRPEDARISLNLTRAYRALGRTDAARTEYERLRKLDPRLAELIDRAPAS